jgi:hypothetical protein
MITKEMIETMSLEEIEAQSTTLGKVKPGQTIREWREEQSQKGIELQHGKSKIDLAD